MSLGKSRLKQSVKGGGLLKLRQLYPTPTDTWSDAGYLGGTTVKEDANMIDLTDERGLAIDWKSSGSIFNLESKLMQSGIDEMNLLKNADGIYWELYYMVLTGEGKYQEINAFVKIQPGLSNIEFAAGTHRILPLMVRGWAVKAACTRTPAGFNIGADASYVLVENAAALGAPSDTAATVAGTVF